MKKSLLVLALMSAFSGAALAQSSVTIYGIVDAGLQNLDTGAATGSTFKLQSGLMKSNRLGFKGTEDLGSGLKASFALEMGLTIDDGASGQGRTFGRISTVGLSGDFGSVEMGRDKTPIHKFIEAFDPFASGYINSGNGLQSVYFVGGTANINGAANAANSSGRMGNAVFYYSPKVSGFSGSAAYSFGEVAGDTTAGSSLGLNLRYTAGALDVGYSLVKDNSQNATPFAINAKSANTFAVSYDFGMIKPVVIVQQVKDQAVVELKQDILTLGMTFKIDSNSRVVAGYSLIDDKTAISAVNANKIGEAKQFAIGYSYDMSKRTSLYTGFASTSQDATSKKLGAAVNGADISEFTVGVRHFF
jgi:predicted porin